MSQRSRSSVLGRVLAILASLLAALATFIVTKSAPDMAPGRGATQHAYAYDLRCAGGHSDAKPQRGPPPACATVTTRAGVDTTLHVCSECSGPAGKPVADTYNDPAEVVQVVDTAATTSEVVPSIQRSAAFGARARVAAKAEMPLIKAGSAGGEAAGNAFPQAVKDAARAESRHLRVLSDGDEGSGRS